MAPRTDKSPNAFRTISEVADIMGVPQHVLRFWESKFSQISPMKRGGGRRYYRPEDVEIIEVIRTLLHDDGYTIKGAQKYLREQGVKTVLQAVHAKAETRAETRAENENQPKTVEPQNDYDAQILNITKKTNIILAGEEDMLKSLKILRARLHMIHQHLET